MLEISDSTKVVLDEAQNNISFIESVINMLLPLVSLDYKMH